MLSFYTGEVILFSNPNSLYGKAISEITGSKWTHAAIVYSRSIDYVILAEALSNGFVLKKHKKRELISRVKKGTAMCRKGEKVGSVKHYCNKYLGKAYGWLQIINIAVKILFKLTLPPDGAKTLICSEGVARVLYDCSGRKIDIAREFNVKFDYVLPKHLAESIQLQTLTLN